MLIFLAMLIAGLVFLVLSGDWLIQGAVSAALKLGVSRILASVLIVGFGTSVPEMLVAVDATLKGAPGLALGNIVGSNIANVLLVLGVPALFLTIRTAGRGLGRSVIVTAIATIIWLAITPYSGLTPTIGAIFLGALIAYVLSTLFRPPSDNLDDLIEDEAVGPPMGWMKTAMFILLGIVGLPLGAHLAINGALGISAAFGIQTELVGLTILAIGTSLPELAAALAATFRRENDMILGNVAGSNLFNLFGAGGIIAMLPLVSDIQRIDLPQLFLTFDHWVMGASFAIFAIYALTRRPIGRLSGIILVALYVAYLAGLYHFYLLGLGWSDLWS